MERHVLWYEFDSGGKCSHVKLPIKENYSHTILLRKDTDSAALGITSPFK